METGSVEPVRKWDEENKVVNEQADQTLTLGRKTLSRYGKDKVWTEYLKMGTPHRLAYVDF